MSVIRAIGLIFILTMLIGGCILAGTSSPKLDTSDQNVVQVSWEGAIGYLQNGDAVAFARSNLTFLLLLKDGTLVSASAPSITGIDEALVRCGQVCRELTPMNL
jgi:hypothetical protein